MMARIIPLSIFLLCCAFIVVGYANAEPTPQVCAVQSVPVYLSAGDHLTPDGKGGFVVERSDKPSTPVEILSYSSFINQR